METRKRPGATPGTIRITDSFTRDLTTDPRTSPAAIEWELAAVAAWTPRRASRLTDNERNQVDELIDGLADQREARADAHRERLARTARRLGRQVGNHLLVLADAEKRLEQLVGMFDPETPVPLTLVDHNEAAAIVGVFFADGMNEAP